MNSFEAASLVNWLGFAVGVALFALLAVMVLRHRGGPGTVVSRNLLLLTAALGLTWNIGELVVFVLRDFGVVGQLPFVTAAAYSALGFLPSVVVHSVQNEKGGRWFVTYIAYAASTAALALNMHAAWTGGEIPSELGLTTLTIAAPALAIALIVIYFRERIERRAVWAAAMLVFVLSSLHFAGEKEGNSWAVELLAHQSSLPLALIILYQNYRFAFADLFLKRAISVILLAAVALGLYAWVAAPLLRYHETHDRNDVLAVTTILVLWIATALAYPSLHRLAVWLVDKVILRRADYARLQDELARSIEQLDSPASILDAVCARLSGVLTAGFSEWKVVENEERRAVRANVDFTPDFAEMIVPTAESPQYRISLGDFHGGRRLLSDETAMLEAVALFTARRIDALRVDHERCEQEFREQEFSKLAAEAQLTALRAQINPHFLFNALTTIGYLIQASPERAFQTLIQLTKLLRGVLSKTAEFCSLGDEIALVESYLEIEKARFEERLKIRIEVPDELLEISVPALILQPLVENAIKHGISENRNGGELVIRAGIQQNGPSAILKLQVTDTGSGKPLDRNRSGSGIGLKNIEGRLESHYGSRGVLHLSQLPDGKIEAFVAFPVENAAGAGGVEVVRI